MGRQRAEELKVVWYGFKIERNSLPQSHRDFSRLSLILSSVALWQIVAKMYHHRVEGCSTLRLGFSIVLGATRLATLPVAKETRAAEPHHEIGRIF